MRNKSFARTALASLVLVVVVSSGLAFAANPFTDVPAGRFFTEPVDWAYNNDITTGTSDTTFEPDRQVTRGENVTFAYRYDQNIVQPAVTGLFASDDRGTDFINPTTSSTDLGLSATVTIPEGRTAVIEIEFSASTTCANGGVGGFCVVTIFNDGVAVGGGEQIMDSSDNGVESGNAWEAHSVKRVTEELSEGEYTITVEARESTGSPFFSLRHAVVTAEAHLVS